MHWYAVQVATKHENKVKKYLEKQKANGLAGKVGQVVAYQNVLPGYVFIEADMWPELYLRGMTTRHRVIGRVSETEIARLAEGPRIAPFKEGDRVEIQSGPLAGLAGTVKRAGCERSKVAVSFFSNNVVVDVENRLLQAI
ncbi:transcription termination/antitermination protein NusG [Candidatus Desulforudis audaxviator]|uniref:transcription termination/antitermination protein NusG n=1 Tax=Candidatus Desulforudis audaxviator TaxID=471827 RepID=UPI000317F321|nr:transcription termination/antitermination NusG family protein [Candidatus Desulforudis audaxviator]